MQTSAQIDIICENTVGRPIPALGEHGFACLITTSAGRWLFDTGNGDTLVKNFSVLDHCIDDLDGIILSHGHYDHTGGLYPLIDKAGPQNVYAHPGVFKSRYWKGQHEQRDISIPQSQSTLERAGATFVFLEEFSEISPGLYFSGPISHVSAHEQGDPHLVVSGQGEYTFTPDQFDDDAALAIMSAKGLVIILGCAHSGLINTVEHFRNKLNTPKVHAIVGGTHLGPASDKQFAETVDYISTLNPDRLGLSHCTGQTRSAQLHARFPGKVFFANVGSSLQV